MGGRSANALEGAGQRGFTSSRGVGVVGFRKGARSVEEAAILD